MHEPFYTSDSLGTEIYDARTAIHIAGSSVDGDVEFYVEQARRWGGPVLDIGCGTGRVAVELAARGFDVVGIDRSVPMLAAAERRRDGLPADVGDRLSFVQADMTEFDLERTFPLIITPFRSFQFMLTSATQRRALASMRRHLRPEGALVLDLFDPRLDLCVPTPDIESRRAAVTNPVTSHRVEMEVIERAPDPTRQIIDEVWRYSEADAAGKELRTSTERLVLRWSLRSEIRLLVELAGFTIDGEFGDFRGGPPAYGLEQIWILRLP